MKKPNPEYIPPASVFVQKKDDRTKSIEVYLKEGGCHKYSDIRGYHVERGCLLIHMKQDDETLRETTGYPLDCVKCWTHHIISPTGFGNNIIVSTEEEG